MRGSGRAAAGRWGGGEGGPGGGDRNKKVMEGARINFGGRGEVVRGWA